YFEKVQDRVVSFVERNSSVRKGKYLELMMRADVIANELGTLVYGPEAVELGLIDALGSLSDALEKLHSMIDESKNDVQGDNLKK
ncbi:MAG: translocation-enhancing protein TepA, partial [Eubacteriales bacterium]